MQRWHMLFWQTELLYEKYTELGFYSVKILLFFMSYWSWKDRITCVTLWRTVCWQMKLQIGTNWQQRTFWKEVCQSCLIQQLSTRGGLFHHNHPINFSSTCHTFRHAISMRIWTESIKARCAVRQRWITKKEKEKIGPGLGNLRISSIVHSTFCTGGEKMQLHVPSQPFQERAVCKNEGGEVGFVPCGGQHSHTLC